MDYIKEGKVFRDEKGMAHKVVPLWQGKEIPFIKPPGRKPIRDDCKNPDRPKIPAEDWFLMFNQVCAIFAGKNYKPKKRKKKPAGPMDLFIPRIDLIQAEAIDLNIKITAHRLKHPAKTWREITLELIKKQINPPIKLQFLSIIERIWLKNLRNGGIKILTEGWLEIPRWKKEANEKPKLIPQKVNGINSALRMHDHILSKYNLGELPKINNIEEVIYQANELLTNWLETDLVARQKIQKKLAGVILRLEKCQNEFKVEVKEQAKKILPFKDASAKINPGAMAARTISALNQLAKRLNELQIVMPFIAMRKELLIFEKRRLAALIQKAANSLRLICRHPVFNNKRITEYEPKILITKINKTLNLLNTVLIFPYREQVEQAKLSLENAKKSMCSKQFSQAGNLLKTSLEILESKLWTNSISF